nr:uncharacterized protein LOC124811952 isoform X2 [Hydra vulgaris]
MNVLSAAKEHAKPDATWHKFKILKVKCYDDDKELCKSYELSSNDEVQALNKNEPIKKENKIMKYTLKKAASSTLTYPTPLQFEASQKKFEAPPKRFKKLEETDTGKSTLTFPLKDMSTYTTPKCDDKVKNELYESFKLSSNNEIEFKIEQRNKNNQIINAYAKKASNTLTTSLFHPTPPKFENPLIDVLPPPKKKIKILKEPVRKSSSFLKDKFRKSTQQEKKKASVFPLEEGNFQYKVIHLLTELKNDVADIKAMLKNENSFDLHQCNSIQEFHDFDQSLLDQDIAKNVKQKLSNIGGLTCSAIAKE